MRSQHLFVALSSLLLALIVPGVSANWDYDKHVGPSKHYEELETDNFLKKVFRKDEDVVVVFYSDHCGVCQDLHPQQEKVAEKIKKETNKIKFVRIDEYRMSGSAEVAFSKRHDAFAAGEIPKMFFTKAGNKTVEQVDHSALGWPGGGTKKMRKWIKERTSFPDELKKSKGGSEL